MNFWEGLLVALESLRGNKLRSALTMLGIIIGVASVIAVVAIGQGGRAAVMGEFNKVGSNLVSFYFKSSDRRISVKDLLTRQDAEAIKKQVQGFVDVAPGSNGQAEARANKIKKSIYITATTENFRRVGNVDLVEGRFFTEAEERAKLKVAVVEEKLLKELFPTGGGLGRKIYLNDTPYSVIGVTKSESSSFNFGPPMYRGYLPLQAWEVTPGSNLYAGTVGFIQGKVAEGANDKEVGAKAVTLLHSIHHNKDKYAMESLEQIKSQVDKATGILGLIVGSIAAISLVVGGIGVMNIMLVSVTERTREIGIRKALGASYGDILRQFLLESSMLCLIGGTIGILLGTGGAFAVSKFAKWPPLVSPSTILIAVSFSLGVGLFFGLYPASRAAKLDPIEALRYE